MAAGLFLVPYYNHPDYKRPRPYPADLTPQIQKKQPMAAFCGERGKGIIGQVNNHEDSYVCNCAF